MLAASCICCRRGEKKESGEDDGRSTESAKWGEDAEDAMRGEMKGPLAGASERRVSVALALAALCRPRAE